MTPPMLHVNLFGPPQVRAAEQPLSIPRSQTRALLYRLAVRTEPIQRDHLCFLFWPDLDDTTARRHLTILISHLRRTLPEPELLLVSPEQVGLNPNRIWSDAATFERLCQKVAASHAEADLETAVSLYRGPFLDGFGLANHAEYELWVERERHRFDHSYQQALTALVDRKAEREQHDKAIRYAQQSLHHDPLNEPMHRRLIALYADTGDRNAARRQFERCAAVLEQELGVEPLPETREAYEAAIAHRRLVVRAANGSVPALTWTALPSLHLPLTGRADALRHLQERLSQALRGQGGFTFIVGEAGMGKSRLLQEFATQQDGAVLVLAGGARPGEYELPYQPLVQALRRGLHLVGDSLAIDVVWLSEASLLLPELRSLYPDLPPPLQPDPKQARPRLFEALTRILFSLAQQSPLLLCLDDLHWTDRTTLDWLAYLAEQMRQQQPVLVVGAYRHEEPDAVLPLRQRLQRQGVLTEVTLTGLPEEAIREILRHAHLAPEMSRSLALPLQKTTGGNTFFVLETVRTLLESPIPADAADDASSFPLPQTVHEAVHARLRSLSAVARQVLEAGSVLGIEFPLDLVQSTAGRSDWETVEALDELVARFLLREQEESYHFQHDIIRTAVYKSLSHGRRRLLHRRTAEALVALRYGDLENVSGQVAAHYTASGLLSAAVPYYRQAAAAARRIYAADEAIRLYHRLLADDLAPFLQPLDRCQVLCDLAEVRLLQGDFVQSASVARQALWCAETLGDPSLIGRCQQILANALHLQGGHTEEALDWLRRARAILTEAGDRENLLRVLWTMGEIYYFLARTEEALEVLTEQKELATELGHPQGLCEALLTMAMVSMLQKQPQSMEIYAHQSYTIATQFDHRPIISRAALAVGNAYSMMRNFSQAYHWYIKVAFPIAFNIGDRNCMGRLLGNMGVIHHYRGEYMLAEQYFRNAIQISLETQDKWSLSVALANLAVTFSYEGKLEQAESILGKVLPLSRKLESPLYLAPVLLELAKIYEWQDEYQRAKQYSDESLDLYRTHSELERTPDSSRLDAEMMTIRSAVALGEISMRNALIQMTQLLTEELRAEDKAVIYYERWKLDPTREEDRIAAAKICRSLYDECADCFHRRRYEELTGERLPDPPPLFDEDPELPLPPPDLETLLAQIDRLLAKLTAEETS